MADIDRLLSKLGPMSGENATRARGFYGANPDQLERKLSGLGGSSGQEGAGGLDIMLDELIKQTSAPQQQQVTQQQLPPIAQQQAAPQQRSAATLPSTGPTRSDSSHGPVGGGGAQTAGGGMDLTDWLLALLGARPAMNAAARGVGGAVGGAVAPQITGPDPNAKRITYQPKLENQGPTEVRNSPELEQKGQARAENDMRVRADVASENAANDALMQQIMQQNQAKKASQDTVNAAKRAVGRR